MAHPKTLHVIFSPAIPSCSQKNPKTITRLCVRSVRAKREGEEKGPVKGRKTIAHVGTFFWKLQKPGPGKAERLLKPSRPLPSAPRTEDN